LQDSHEPDYNRSCPNCVAEDRSHLPLRTNFRCARALRPHRRPWCWNAPRHRGQHLPQPSSKRPAHAADGLAQLLHEVGAGGRWRAAAIHTLIAGRHRPELPGGRLFCSEIGISTNDLKAGRSSESALATRLLALKGPQAALCGLMGQMPNLPVAPDADDKPAMIAYIDLLVKALGAIMRASSSASPTGGGGTDALTAGGDDDDKNEVLLSGSSVPRGFCASCRRQWRWFGGGGGGGGDRVRRVRGIAPGSGHAAECHHDSWWPSRGVVGEGVGEVAGTRGWMPPRQLAAVVPRGSRRVVGEGVGEG